MKTPAYLYLRVSKEDGPQGGGKQGLQDQRTQITAAFGEKYEFRGEFVDENTSRKVYMDARPAGKKLLAALLGNGVRTVLIANSDRLGLLKQAQTFLGQCERMEPRVEVLTPDGTNQVTDYIQSGIGGIVSEKGYHDLIDRLQAGRKRLAAQGKRCGGRWPYGHHPRHEFDHEREVLGRVLEMNKQGASYYAICKHLNSLGIKTRLGNHWVEMTVRRMLKRGPAQ
jgi:DNA invertase Pin-like site-specific DNA recombinase